MVEAAHDGMAATGTLPAPRRRPITSAEILAVGSELTTGETRDTNAGDLARALTAKGVRITRLVALPDDLDAVTAAFSAGLASADLVVSTGGLGPTPDDLTREAIAAACGESVSIDPELEAWLRGLWARRRMPFPELNLKQAWLIPSASSMPNPNGTAPGWWVDRPDGRVVIALPGPPREMRPMWATALERLAERSLGRDQVVRTIRTAGVGESQLADLLGEEMLRRPNPSVATYARADAVDVRIAAIGESAGGRRSSAEALAIAAEAEVLAILGRYAWGRDLDTWAAAIGSRLAARGWRLAMREIGTGGSVMRLLGDAPWLTRGELVPAESGESGATGDDAAIETFREASGADVALVVRARPRGTDMTVVVTVATPARTHREERPVFLGGDMGRQRAALAAAAILFEQLGPESPVDVSERAPDLKVERAP